MGKLFRGALWVALPPAGAAASYRAGKRKDTDRIVNAINGPQGPSVWVKKDPSEIPVRRGGTQTGWQEFVASGQAKQARKRR